MRIDRVEITGALNCVSAVALLTSCVTCNCTVPSTLIVGRTTEFGTDVLVLDDLVAHGIARWEGPRHLHERTLTSNDHLGLFVVCGEHDRTTNEWMSPRPTAAVIVASTSRPEMPITRSVKSPNPPLPEESSPPIVVFSVPLMCVSLTDPLTPRLKLRSRRASMMSTSIKTCAGRMSICE